MSKKIRLCSLFIALALFCIPLVACSPQGLYPIDDVLTQTMLSEDKTPITVLVKNAFSINAFENAVEDKFPNIDIIQVGNYSCDMGIAEYEARIKNDDLTDIVMTWPLDVGEQYWSERLMDLSSWSLSGKYATSMLNNIARDGKLYYLPGPSQVRSILYNKTLFAEKGWTVPTDFESFISLCHSIENSGIRSLQLGLGNSEVFDTAFTGFGYDSSYSSTRNAQFISNYNLGNGNFVDNFAPALETFQRLVDEGILKPSDLDVYYQDRERMLFNRECAMVEDSVLLARAGNNFNGCTDEFALMPFFNPGEKGDWARLYPVCYVGVNKHLEEPKNSKKLSIVKDILEYISTVEGQQSLSADTGAMFSSLLGTTPPDIPEIKDLVSTLNNGRYAVFNPLKNAQVALREGLKGIVRGNKTIEDVCAMVDKQNRNPPIIAFHLMLATATESFTMIETGNFLTDAMREYSGCDIALFLDNGKDGRNNGKGICGRLYKGDVTYLDIKRILPDLRHEEKGVLWKIKMTGENLIRALEYSLTVDNHKAGWFYYFSGLVMEYAPSFPQGSRIRKITDIDGKPIDKTRIYSVAVSDYSVDDSLVLSCDKTDVSIFSIFEGALSILHSISPSEDHRFKVYNEYKK